ncbi:glycolipid transfer protein-like [Ischnura elegans]|uniref:glycolipid transfer protein-like n=1 Tax=Ischnura elegans TaxID=197161 RepID=UPI001ED8A597|nr:glycolipid transfer protein-like [Ischnura elegans]
MDKLKPFPAVPSDGKIETIPFLKACRSVVKLLETFGPVLMPAVDDIHGNVKKLEKIYMENQTEFKYLNGMLLEEKRKMGCHARIALLWLRRGLELFFVLFSKVVEQHAAGKVLQDLRPLIKQAYEETLEKFHGYRTKQMCMGLMEKFRKYKDFLQIMGANDERSESSVFTILPVYLDGIKCSTEAIYNRMVKKNQVEKHIDDAETEKTLTQRELDKIKVEELQMLQTEEKKASQDQCI